MKVKNKDFFKSQETDQDSSFNPNIPKRHRLGKTWLLIFQLSTLVGILALSALLYNVINDSFGLAAFNAKVEPSSLTGGRPLTDLSEEELISIIQENTTSNRLRTIEKEKPLSEMNQDELIQVVMEEVVKPTVVKTWTLTETFFRKGLIQQELEEIRGKNPNTYTEFRSWVSIKFITSTQNSNPLMAGISTAILGSLLTILITMLFSIPIGVGAAIYLEEYGNPDQWINKVIQTNINNLAAVPSIIYGMLGLTIFVRGLAPLTSGAFFGLGDPNALNGRTIVSGGLTLGILVLPLVIINAQEAIRAVPSSLRQASYGLGATKWQTIKSHVLPNSIPGILTGTILAVSRAFGETAPLIVVGVSTYITVNPSSIFSQFTSLPAQIYQWTARPQDVWRSLAAGAIIVLLVLLLALNATAILLRNKYSRDY
jgi:phosphate transport system permease protein